MATIPTETSGAPNAPGSSVEEISSRLSLRRREWLLAAVGSATLVGGVATSDSSLADSPARLPSIDANRRLVYFTAGEASFVDAAIDRLIPGDALGPGAAEAGVTVFIDHQLAGPYGKASDWYMQGPWAQGTEQQGYQRRRTPAEVYRAGIAAIDERSHKASNASFAALAPNARDEWLHALEDGKIDLGDVSAKTFFTLLWADTQAGFFADPLYLGNRNFAGWKLIGYPGPRYNYDSAIRRFGERYPLPTVGLMGRDPSRQPKGPL